MRRHNRPPIGMTEDKYARLYQDVLGHFGASVQGDPTPVEDLRLSLYRCIRPWVNLDSLRQCDKRILRILDEEVREVRGKLMPRHFVHSAILTRSVGVLIAISVAVTMIEVSSPGGLANFEAGERLSAAWQYVDGLRAQLWFAAVQSSTNQRLILLAGMIVVMGVFLLRDTRRT
ncbi:MAG: hypothetical protein HKN47_04615 [Pirellulaceae bacterium]|nr:hypothetical protein [Pirellulaceae bacterium]